MAFVVCGVVAGVTGIAIFNSEPHHNPMDAMALAPAEAVIAAKPAQLATQSEKRLANGPSARKAGENGKAGSIKPICGESPGAVREGDCTPIRVVRKRPPKAVNERPLIAEVPIGHRDGSIIIPASPPAPIAISPLLGVPPEEPKTAPARTETSVGEETSPDAASAAVTPPASMSTVTSEKPQRRHRASRRHNQYSYTSRSSRYSVSRTYLQGGYARLW
jgi:hypothetical protein